MAVLLSPNAKQQFLTSSGALASGYKLYTYAAGTVNEQATYTNRAGTVANTNPIILDARGEATIYLTPGVVYDYVLKSAADVIEWTREGVAADAGDADAVGFTQEGTGMVLRNLGDKGRDIVHADDRGLVGDASDETTALQDLFTAAAGKVLMLGHGKTYGVNGTLAIPENTTLISNGSKFRKLGASAAYGITTPDNFTADVLSLDIVGGAGVQDAGIQIGGSNTSVDIVRVTALTEGATGSDPIAGVYVGVGGGGVVDKVDIGRIVVSGVQLPCIFDGVRSGLVGYVGFSGYKRGLYIKDCQSLTVNSGRAESIYAAATGSAGQNAVLIESSTGNRSCADVYINNFTSAQSPEHGFRVGGQYIARNIHFNDCASFLAGSGTSPGGGCGIKVLGPTSVPAYHEGIFINNMLVEDASNLAGENHHVADFSLVDGLHVNGLVGRKRTRTYSGYGGLRINKLKNATIDANITDANIGALRFKDDAGFTGLVSMKNVRISGLFDTGGTSADAITMDCLDTTYENVSVHATVSGGRAATRIEAPTGSGAYTSVSMTLDYLQQDTGTAALTGAGAASILCHVRGLWGGTATAKDGSFYQDMTNGVVKYRKAGGWYTL